MLHIEIGNMGFSYKFLMLYGSLLVLFVIFIISEVLLVKSIKKSKKDDSIWLAINILLPIVGFVIYKLTHKVTVEE